MLSTLFSEFTKHEKRDVIVTPREDFPAFSGTAFFIYGVKPRPASL